MQQDQDYECENCGARFMSNPGSSEWRWNGKTMEHRCPNIDPQAGHFECKLIPMVQTFAP